MRGEIQIIAAGSSMVLSAWLLACSGSSPMTSPTAPGTTDVNGVNGASGSTGASGTTAATAGEGRSTTGVSGTTGSNNTGGAAGKAGSTGGGDVMLTGGGGSTGSAGAGAAGAGAAGAGAAGTGAAGAPAEEKCDKVLPPSMDCSAPLAPGDRRSCTLGTRQYEVYAGKTLNPCKPVPLVIDAHGATETAVQQAGEMEFCAGALCWHGLGSGWKAEADTPGGGFIVVFPQGINNVWDNTDADYMVQIVAEMKKNNTIDEKKVYISGISNGGALTYWTGCPHSDVFHGMAPHSAGDNCTAVTQPIPVIQFDDMPDFAYQSSVDATNTMVMLEHCKGGPKPWVTVDGTYTEAVCRSAKEDVNATLVPCNTVMSSTPLQPTTCQMWDQCDGNVEIVFCEVAANTEHGAGNEATDGHIIYENNTILNTPSLAWRFFKRFW
jgi:poly(3-hydroxybutyrate) depolymerase